LGSLLPSSLKSLPEIVSALFWVGSSSLVFFSLLSCSFSASLFFVPSAVSLWRDSLSPCGRFSSHLDSLLLSMIFFLFPTYLYSFLRRNYQPPHDAAGASFFVKFVLLFSVALVFPPEWWVGTWLGGFSDLGIFPAFFFFLFMLFSFPYGDLLFPAWQCRVFHERVVLKSPPTTARPPISRFF